jgi:DNA sulfur modification protein DndE
MKNTHQALSLIAFFFAFIFSSNQFPDDRLTVFLCGDSTMADKLPADKPETGWGMILPTYFNEAVQVQNHAINGRSTKSFINEGRWQKVINQVKKGDWVLIQFGHNDAKVSDTTKYAPAQTTYRQNLVRFITETRAKGGNPVLITPVMRRKFDENSQFLDTHADYPAVTKTVATQLQVPLIDLHAKSQKVIEQHGIEGSKSLFMHYVGGIFQKFPKGIIDDTHFSRYGAEIMASLVAEGIVEQSLGLRAFLKKSEFIEKYVFELPKTYSPVFRKDTFNIARYGAKANGQTLNSQAINQAIGLCSTAGGGVVQVPAGLWLTGPIVMQSNVNLHLERGAVLQFSRNYADYPLVLTTWEGQEAYRCQAPISGADLQHVAITGAGVIDGGGEIWRQIKKSKQTAGQWAKLVENGGTLNDKKDTWFPTDKSLKGQMALDSGLITKKTLTELATIKDFLRPNMLSLSRCRYVLLDGNTFQNSPAWTLHPLLCQHVTIRNVSVKNQWYAQNGDGLDLESCQNGVVENCTFDTGDDGITIKSGRDEQGRKRGIPTEDFIVRDCQVYHAHGGFVIGSEMSGGVRNMYVSNCTFMGTDVGLRFKTARGRGGIVENIYVNNINMTEIAGEAILFDMYYAAKDPVPQGNEKAELPQIETKPLNEGTPQFKAFYVRNITCLGAETGIMVRGLPEMNVQDVLIENAVIESNKGLICIEGTNISLKNISILTKQKTVGTIQNSQNVTLDQINYRANADLFLKIEGSRSKAIQVRNTTLNKTIKPLELGQGVLKSEVNIKK